MSEASATSAEGKPKSKKLLLIIVAAVLILGLGGGGFLYFKRGGDAEKEKAEKAKKLKEKEKAKSKDEEESTAEESAADEKSTKDDKDGKEKKGKSNVSKIDLPDDKDVKKVIELQPFVVNLADKGESRYLRMTVSIGIGETKEEKTDPLLMTRVRNAMLSVLTMKTSDDVLTVEGKTVLRKDLLRAARAAVEEPRIEAIYITDFIVQL